MEELPDWMETSHYLVLLALNSSDMIRIYKPSVISQNTPVRRETVQDALSDLVDREFVEKLDRGKYRISKQGRDLLVGHLETDEFEEDGGDG